MTLTELFTNIANAIRAKTGSTEPIIAEDFPSAIEAISTSSSGGVSLITTTITDEQLEEWPSELTIPELIGAKYFIIQGNPLTDTQISKTNYTDDAGLISQLIYLDGIKISATYSRAAAANVSWVVPITSTDPDAFTFDETTGTVIVNSLFYRPSKDTTEGTVYTVYALK